MINCSADECKKCSACNNRLLSTELQFLEAGLAGYMLRVAPSDKFNDELLSKLSKCIEMAKQLEGHKP